MRHCPYRPPSNSRVLALTADGTSRYSARPFLLGAQCEWASHSLAGSRLQCWRWARLLLANHIRLPGSAVPGRAANEYIMFVERNASGQTGISTAWSDDGMTSLAMSDWAVWNGNAGESFI